MQKIATLCFSQFVVILYSPLYYPNEGTGQKSHPFCWFYCSETNICFPVANDGHDGHNDSDGATFTSAVSRHLMSEAEKRNIYRKCVLIFSPMSGGGGEGGPAVSAKSQHCLHLFLPLCFSLPLYLLCYNSLSVSSCNLCGF